MAPHGKFILFDIDGTLIKGGNPAHLGGYPYAFKNVLGIDINFNRISTSGFTELQGVMTFAQLYEVKKEIVLSKLELIYESMWNYFLTHSPQDMTSEVLVGIRPLLERLYQEQYLLGVVSGGMTRISWEKLNRAGLRQFFSLGAFGEEAERRSQLIRLVLGRAREQTGVSYGRKNTLFIGDTPTDVQSAHENQLNVLAIASWTHSFEELVSYQPEAVLQDTKNTMRVTKMIEEIFSNSLR